MRLKIMVILTVCFVLAGCATPKTRVAWSKGNATKEQTLRDRFDCKIIAQQTLGWTTDIDLIAPDIFQSYNEGRELLAECMRSRGYVPRGVEPNVR